GPDDRRRGRLRDRDHRPGRLPWPGARAPVRRGGLRPVSRLELISARLEQVNPALAEVEEQLATAVRGADRLTEGPAAHLSDAGGKRLRPLLTVVTAQLGSGANDDVV